MTAPVTTGLDVLEASRTTTRAESEKALADLGLDFERGPDVDAVLRVLEGLSTSGGHARQTLASEPHKRAVEHDGQIHLVVAARQLRRRSSLAAARAPVRRTPGERAVKAEHVIKNGRRVAVLRPLDGARAIARAQEVAGDPQAFENMLSEQPYQYVGMLGRFKNGGVLVNEDGEILGELVTGDSFVDAEHPQVQARARA
jgi:hypothetical protein